jgi:hypothetical protein
MKKLKPATLSSLIILSLASSKLIADDQASTDEKPSELVKQVETAQDTLRSILEKTKESGSVTTDPIKLFQEFMSRVHAQKTIDAKTIRDFSITTRTALNTYFSNLLVRNESNVTLPELLEIEKEFQSPFYNVFGPTDVDNSAVCQSSCLIFHAHFFSGFRETESIICQSLTSPLQRFGFSLLAFS